MSAKWKYILMGFLVIFTGFIVANIIRADMHKKQVKAIYEEAENLIAEESYTDARKKLETIEDDNYRDTVSLINLCKAHEMYDIGNVSSASSLLRNVTFPFQGIEQLKKIENFRKVVEIEYELALKREMEDRRKRLENGVPYVGMWEGDIGRTSLGEPAPEIRHNNEMKNGNIYQANLYDFKEGNATIFTARCVDGWVTQVWDRRDEPRVSYTPNSSSSKKKTETDDPYHAADYYHPEDFYDDYYDDFWDFEDAEDYWYEHQK